MGRRRTAAEQIGVPDLDEQEERAVAEAKAEFEAKAEQERLAAEAKPPEPEPPAVPDWVPEKFRKDPAKFAEAHRHLEDQLRQRGERQTQLEARIAELEEQTRPRPDPGDLEAQLADFYEQDPLATMRWLADQSARAVVGQALGEQAKAGAGGENMQNTLFVKAVNDVMSSEFEDWAEVRDDVSARIREDPTLVPEAAFGGEDPLGQVTRHLSMIYKNLKYDSMLEEQQELRERGLQQKDLDRARKQEAQTLSGASGRAPEPTEAEKELAAMRAALASSSYGLHRAQEKRS